MTSPAISDNEAAVPLLSVQNLKMQFPIRRGLTQRQVGTVKAVDDVSFDIAKGKTFGLVGESGCGKTTIGKCVLQINQPVAGRILYKGFDLVGADRKALGERRRQMQLIFQDPYGSLDPRQPVISILREAIEAGGERVTDWRARAGELLDIVELGTAMGRRYPHEMSGGQRQRLGIARALACEPELIVCDEPVSALDVSIQAQIINLLMELQRSLGVSLLFISHNLAVVRHISHRVMVLYLGKIMEIAERDDFYARPLHPYSQALISAVPIADPRLERGRPRVLLQGDIPSPINPPSGCRFRTRCPKATAICAEQEPAMRDYGVGHFAACHHIGE